MKSVSHLPIEAEDTNYSGLYPIWLAQTYRDAVRELSLSKLSEPSCKASLHALAIAIQELGVTDVSDAEDQIALSNEEVSSGSSSAVAACVISLGSELLWEEVFRSDPLVLSAYIPSNRSHLSSSAYAILHTGSIVQSSEKDYHISIRMLGKAGLCQLRDAFRVPDDADASFCVVLHGSLPCTGGSLYRMVTYTRHRTE